tara:strand:+ start:50 stop:829 length:780 start_codon:yes stop_codon:yes gene_type:complete
MVMRTVNRNDAFNKKDFVNAMKDLSDLEHIAQNIGTPEGQFDPSLRQDSGVLLKNDPTFYTELTPDVVISDVQDEHKGYQKGIQNYTITHFNNLLGKVKGKSLLQFVTSLPIVKTGKRNIDKVIDAINEKKRMAKIAKEGGVQEYVMEKLSKASKSRRDNFFNYLVGSQGYVEKTFQAYAQEAEINFNKAVLNSEGNVKADVLRSVMKKSYNEFVDKNTESDDKVAEVYLSAIASGAYQAVKPVKRVKKGRIARTGKVA